MPIDDDLMDQVDEFLADKNGTLRETRELLVRPSRNEANCKSLCTFALCVLFGFFLGVSFMVKTEPLVNPDKDVAPIESSN